GGDLPNEPSAARAKRTHRRSREDGSGRGPITATRRPPRTNLIPAWSGCAPKPSPAYAAPGLCDRGRARPRGPVPRTNPSSSGSTEQGFDQTRRGVNPTDRAECPSQTPGGPAVVSDSRRATSWDLNSERAEFFW